MPADGQAHRTAANDRRAGEDAPPGAVERPPHLRMSPGRRAPRPGTGSRPRAVMHNAAGHGWVEGVSQGGMRDKCMHAAAGTTHPREKRWRFTRADRLRRSYHSSLMRTCRVNRTTQSIPSGDEPSLCLMQRYSHTGPPRPRHIVQGVSPGHCELDARRARSTFGRLRRERHVPDGNILQGGHVVTLLGGHAMLSATRSACTHLHVSDRGYRRHLASTVGRSVAGSLGNVITWPSRL